MRRCDIDWSEAQAKWEHDQVDTWLDCESYPTIVRIFTECAAGGDFFEDTERLVMIAVMEGADARKVLRERMLDYLTQPKNFPFWEMLVNKSLKDCK